MAVFSECGIHGNVAHSGGRCMQCEREKEEKELEEWMKKPDNEKFRDLYLIIKRCGRNEVF